jgi:hypothetical protein
LSVIKRGSNLSATKIQSSKLEPVIIVMSTISQLTKLYTWPAYITSARTAQRTLSQQLCYCCAMQLSHRLQREHRFPVSPLVRVRDLLPSNRCCLQSHYLATGLHATLLLFSEGCACDICDRPHLPSPWLGSCSDYSPTAPAAPSLSRSSQAVP